MTMPRELALGGLRFRIDLPPGLELREADPNYHSFLVGRSRPAPEVSVHGEVSVQLELGPAPDTNGLPVLFDTGESWIAFRDGDGVIVRMRAPGGGCGSPEGPRRGTNGDYLWQARLGEGRPGSVVIHCGRALVDDDEGILVNPLHYPLDQLLAMLLLASCGGVVVHAAGVERDGRGVLFAGRSGAGKSTWMRLAAPREGWQGLSDDRVIVRRFGRQFRLYGTPWAGEGQVAANRSAELAAVIFLHQAPRNELCRIDRQEAMAQLLPTASVPWFEPARTGAALELCAEITGRLPAYELRFRPEPAATDLVAELM